MTDRPILFTTPMVRAILSGRKTQTRRLVKPAPAWAGPGTWRTLHDVESEGVRCPYGAPGDRLWVRETFSAHVGEGGGEAGGRRCRPSEADYVVLADGTQVWRSGEVFPPLPAYAAGAFDRIKWRPSIHMPRWASRITLEVTGVRAERLQDITEEDARAEGVTPLRHDPEGDCWSAQPPERQHRAAFEHLWGEINGWPGQPKARAPWASNPWVWVVGLRVVPREEPAK